MANKINLDDSLTETRSKGTVERKQETRNKRVYFLIVCEGEKTEPNYFKSIKETIPKEILTVLDIDVKGTGKNTENVIEKAIKFRENKEKISTIEIDQVWAVFDKDSFPDEKFNNAINLGENNKVYCAWTNEAFELWYLLHFNYYNTGVSRKQYKGLIEKAVRKESGNRKFIYTKNSKEMYSILKQYGDENQAIQFSKKLEARYAGNRAFAKQNPCTKVYKLILELNKQISK